MEASANVVVEEVTIGGPGGSLSVCSCNTASETENSAVVVPISMLCNYSSVFSSSLVEDSFILCPDVFFFHDPLTN